MNAQVIAHQAVAQHVLLHRVSGLANLYTAAMESGFHLAMLCAGLGCAAAMFSLIGLEVTQLQKKRPR